MLSIIGYDIGNIDGVIGEKTVIAMNEIASRNNIFGFDFASMFPIIRKDNCWAAAIRQLNSRSEANSIADQCALEFPLVGENYSLLWRIASNW